MTDAEVSTLTTKKNFELNKKLHHDVNSASSQDSEEVPEDTLFRKWTALFSGNARKYLNWQTSDSRQHKHASELQGFGSLHDTIVFPRIDALEQ